jgi:hypothetical protein
MTGFIEFFISVRLKRLVLLACVSLLLAACDVQKPKYPLNASPRLETTISSDGKLVATLARSGAEDPLLRIKWLDKDEPWQTLPAPMFTNSIRFGLKGYGLLLSHALPDDLTVGQLTRWDLGDLRKESEAIYQGPHLAFPVEVKPGEYLVRTCEPYRDQPDSCRRGGSTSWMLVSANHEPVTLTPNNRNITFSQPNVTDKGFFWVADHVKPPAPKSLELLAYALPDGEAPRFDLTRIPAADPVSAHVDCDQSMQRCLHHYMAGYRPNSGGKFIWAPEVIFDSQVCKVEGVSGYLDTPTITPDGRTAVLAVAPAYDQPRHLVVLRFAPGQCEPVSIEHLNL